MVVKFSGIVYSQDYVGDTVISHKEEDASEDDGYLYIDSTGALRWIDDTVHIEKSMRFERGEVIGSGADSEDYVLPESDMVAYSRSYFENMSDKELSLARNEIFAKHGRKFKDASLQSYFESKSWYVPLYSAEEFDPNMDSILNEFEKANVTTIQGLEADRRQN